MMLGDRRAALIVNRTETNAQLHLLRNRYQVVYNWSFLQTNHCNNSKHNSY